jgi:ABC-type multidrug transport system fused ATPase/permease subunit
VRVRGITTKAQRLQGSIDEEDDEQGKPYDHGVVRRLLRYLSGVKLLMAVGGAAMVIKSLAAISYPLLIAIAIDNYIVNGNYSGLTVIVIIYAVIALVGWGAQFVENRCLDYAGQTVLLKLRTQMFDHLQQMSMNFFENNATGKIMSRVQNDVQQLQQLLTYGFLNIVTSVITIVGIAIAMVVLQPLLAATTLILLPVLFVILFIWQKHASRAFTKVRRAIAVVNAGLQENISGVRVIQSMSREDTNFEQFEQVNREHLGANVKAIRLSSIMLPLVEILMAIAIAVAILLGGNMVLDGTITVGILIGFLMFILRFFNPVRELSMLYTLLQRAMASGARIFELLDVKQEITDVSGAIQLPPVTGEIKFSSVYFNYTKDVEVLHDVNLTVNPGETVAIVGKTGAGKSTIINLIYRFYEVGSGSITIDGHDIRSVTHKSLTSQLGIVPQDPYLFSGTIADNIRYGKLEASDEDIVKAAKKARAHTFISHLELKYDTQVGERGGNLSLGQRQIICLARVILANPKILILDEATSNIDIMTETLIQKALRSLASKRTCLVIAHRLSTITSADRIIVMDKGRPAEQGSHQELLAQKGMYYNMYTALNSSKT